MTIQRGLASNIGRLTLTFPLLSAACGAPAPGEDPGDRPETVGAQVSAVEAVSDAPVAVAQEIKDANGNSSVWILTCDSSHRLLRQKYQGWWSPIEYFDSDCGAPPAFAYFDPTWHDGWLYEHGLSDNRLWAIALNQNGTYGLWKDVSGLTGVYNLAGAPVFIGHDWLGTFNWQGVAAKADNNHVVTFGYSNEFGDAWRADWVLKSNGSRVYSDNSLSPYLAGRRTYSGDDNVGWVADSGNCSGCQYTIQRTFSGVTGTPVKAWVNGAVWIVAPFGSTLKYSRSDSSSWSSFPSCSIGGSPTDPGALPWGYVRASNGKLLRWDMTNHTCTSLGGSVASAPGPVFPISSDGTDPYGNDVTYKGANGNLWYYDGIHSRHIDTSIAMP